MPQPREEKTVFISYRRSASRWITRLIFHHLREQGYDVFMDVESINAGEFERIILGQIAAKAHFLAVLSFESLDRIKNPDDWLRKEIEFAIEKERNIIPVLHGGLRMEQAKPDLTGALEIIPKLNALTIPDDYFDAAMERLCTRFLKLPVYIDIEKPAPDIREAAQRRVEEVEQEKVPTEKELSAEEWFNRGVELGNNLRHKEANEIFSKAIELNPDYTLAYYNRGVSYSYLEEYDKAINDYTQAILLDPVYAMAYNSRGVAYRILKEYDKAIDDYTQAILLSPNDADSYNNRGVAYFNMKAYNKAIKDYKKALSINPNLELAKRNLELAQKALEEGGA